MKTVSIVMTYYNRYDLLFNTLSSISCHTLPYQIIIVDDASDEPLKDSSLIDDFSYLPIDLITVKKEDKWWCNPCVPFNIGFSKSASDVTIIQNAECYHVGDVVSEASKIQENEYCVFGCYSLPQNVKPSSDYDCNNRSVLYCGDDGWYQHSMYRPVAYHFTSAITTSKLKELGGFDERFALGTSYDDDGFLLKMRKHLTVKLIDNPYTFHQWHYFQKTLTEEMNTLITERHKINKDILEQIRKELI